MKIKCSLCGKEFERGPDRVVKWRLKHGIKAYCSEECRRKGIGISHKKLWDQDRKLLGKIDPVHIFTEEDKQHLSQIMKQKWRDVEFIEKIMKARNQHPNKLESLVSEMLDKYMPNEWKYNGNFECGVSIGGLIPDFVNLNGKKAVIEVFGDPFHGGIKTNMNIAWKATEFGRRAVFSQYGYKVVILWSHDLIKREAEERVVNILHVEGVF